MKKRNQRKGFTIVELVIVIAVIAILAGVLIPTFGNVIEKANYSAEKQAAVNTWKEAYALDLSDGVLDGYDGEKIDANKIKTTGYAADANGKVTFTYEGTKSKTTFTWTENDTTDGAGAWTEAASGNNQTPNDPAGGGE